MIFIKKHETEFGAILALCDEELIGKKFSEGERELDLNSYSGFYTGEKIDEAAAAEIVSQTKIYSANVVGKRSVGIFLKQKLVKKENVKKISDVPFVQVYNVSEL